ncbi:hypothetical protein ER308_08855 [Egibacter rhizosphaerae]|uniref:GIY-YIG nuclease family protein n=1 Tax=Egibacter rhizosphaerae TaxID=1670831 RepID=A0A411YEM5_9ACTN|nr:hypothetical protein [Egibacter rhizosphaerae]QBI19650.1 hypothetical protein ER308_08855 [Egibacter rhizosphaerae]
MSAEPANAAPEPGRHMQALAYLPRDARAGVCHLELADPAVNLAVVRSDSLTALAGPLWAVPGCYVLLGPGPEPGSTRLYVGQSPQDVRGRLGEQVELKDWWEVAVAVSSAAANRAGRWTSACVGYLEGALYRRLQAEATLVDNHRTPGDHSIDAFRRHQLDRVTAPVLSLLRLQGLAAATEVLREADDARVETTETQPTWRAAAQWVLRRSATPLSVAQVLDRIRAHRLRDTDTATPEQTLFRTLREAATDPADPITRSDGTPLRYHAHPPTRAH